MQCGVETLNDCERSPGRTGKVVYNFFNFLATDDTPII